MALCMDPHVAGVVLHIAQLTAHAAINKNPNHVQCLITILTYTFHSSAENKLHVVITHSYVTITGSGFYFLEFEKHPTVH